MTDPQPSKYDKTPLDPNAKGDPNPTPETDVHVPEVAVAWQTRPSFNADPNELLNGKEGGADGGESNPPAEAFTVNLRSVGEQVNNMLGTSRELVNEYEALKAKVMANPDTIFGQTSMTTDAEDNPSSAYLAPGTVNPPANGDTHWATDYQEPAKEFAKLMNPHQQKTLETIGGALDAVGQYIARVNNAGQVYAQSDRKSKFPDPPAASM
jgi:hypothetical protein